jgi:hypothetical protein
MGQKRSRSQRLASLAWITVTIAATPGVSMAETRAPVNPESTLTEDLLNLYVSCQKASIVGAPTLAAGYIETFPITTWIAKAVSKSARGFAWPIIKKSGQKIPQLFYSSAHAGMVPFEVAQKYRSVGTVATGGGQTVSPIYFGNFLVNRSGYSAYGIAYDTVPFFKPVGQFGLNASRGEIPKTISPEGTVTYYPDQEIALTAAGSIAGGALSALLLDPVLMGLDYLADGKRDTTFPLTQRAYSLTRGIGSYAVEPLQECGRIRDELAKRAARSIASLHNSTQESAHTSNRRQAKSGSASSGARNTTGPAAAASSSHKAQ